MARHRTPDMGKVPHARVWAEALIQDGNPLFQGLRIWETNLCDQLVEHPDHKD